MTFDIQRHPRPCLTVTIRPLQLSDIPSMAWAGSPHFLQQVEADLLQPLPQTNLYLVACHKQQPVGMGGIDFRRDPHFGYIWRLSVDSRYRSRGVGTALIKALEQQMLNRGYRGADIAVEITNPRAKALYERLGYSVYDRIVQEWDEQDETGALVPYQADCIQMCKQLG